MKKKNEWILDNWFKKLIHVFGWIWFALFMLGIASGIYEVIFFGG